MASQMSLISSGGVVQQNIISVPHAFYIFANHFHNWFGTVSTRALGSTRSLGCKCEFLSRCGTDLGSTRSVGQFAGNAPLGLPREYTSFIVGSKGYRQGLTIF